MFIGKGIILKEIQLIVTINEWTYSFIFFWLKFLSEFRFESPISISKWNNWLDFRRKSENYFKVKIFSDSRPKSAQKLILKVFSDFRAQHIMQTFENFQNFNLMLYMC